MDKVVFILVIISSHQTFFYPSLTRYRTGSDQFARAPTFFKDGGELPPHFKISRINTEKGHSSFMVTNMKKKRVTKGTFLFYGPNMKEVMATLQ